MTGNSADHPENQTWQGKLAARFKQAARVAAGNLRVWIPVFDPAEHQARLVRFWSRERRVGNRWTIELPARCWACLEKQDLVSTTYGFERRSFERPLPTVAVAGSVALALAALAVLMGSPVALAAAAITIVGGGCWIALHSSAEEVAVAIFSCTKHADRVSRPEIYIDENELFLYAPSEGLAQALRDDLRAERGLKRAYTDEVHGRSGEAAGAADGPGEREYEPRFGGQERPDLPPIELADDEEDDQVGGG